MIALANLAVLFLLSFMGMNKDPHGLHHFANDPLVREMLQEGRFREFESAVEGFAGMRLTFDLNRARGIQLKAQVVREALRSSAELTGLLGTLQRAVKAVNVDGDSLDAQALMDSSYKALLTKMREALP
jgi:hypothetical protein